MSSRDLPARPHVDHLRNEAKALYKAFRSGEATALQRVRGVLGDQPLHKLTDAQRVVAREYGFPTWARLREQVQAARDFGNAVTAFLAAVQAEDLARARGVLRIDPRLATESLHVAAVLGLADEVRRLIAEDPSQVGTRAGDPGAEPLLWLCFSPFHGESDARDTGLLASARLLLAAGADPNTRDGRYGVPALYAVTGMRSVLSIARLLLDAGANPTDGESVFHAAEVFHEEALELLLAAGADLNATGDWGNTPLYFLLRWRNMAREERARRGMLWLLDHGADPNVACAKERESSLHVAVRTRQPVSVIQLLLDRGADVNARRGDGSTALLLARRAGADEVAALLESIGAATEPLSPLDLLLAACGRGDADAARRLTSPAVVNALRPEDQQLLPDAAASGRASTVAACLAAGFPVDALDAFGATALHHSAIHGRTGQLRMLLDAGADTAIRDPQHSSTPLGWAFFGADSVADADGDYEGSVRVLLDAGARVLADEHQPAHEGVRRVLQQRAPA